MNIVADEKDLNTLMPWYNGLSLFESLDKLKAPLMLGKKPLRIPIQDIYRIQGVGWVFAGKVATGTFVPGMQLYSAPGIHMN